MKENRVYIEHALQSITRIETYCRQGQQTFLDSSLIQDAVLRNLQTLSESMQRLSDDLKSEHQEVDWRAISGFRNVLVHDYLGIDIQRIWHIIETDLPPLLLQLQRIKRTLPPPTD